MDEDDGVDMPRHHAGPRTLGDEAGRPAWVVYPDAYDHRDESRLWPLVMMIHGGGSSSFYHDRFFGFSSHVNSHGFVALMPNGTVNSNGLRFWNGIRCCDFEHTGVDDVGYLKGLLQEAPRKLRVDPKRIYVIGHSNGGAMTQILACEHSSLIAATATVAPGEIPDNCTPSHPMSMMEVCVAVDPYVKEPLCSAVVGNWTRADRCNPVPVLTEMRDYDCDPTRPAGDNEGFNSYHDWNCKVPGKETQVQVFECPETQTEVQYMWMGGNTTHTPNLNPRWSNDMLSWLLRQKYIEALE